MSTVTTHQTRRMTVQAAEEMIDVIHPCLDKGFVRLVDYMGGDARIVQSARVSYGDGTKTVSEDGALIDRLWREKHTSPFEQVILTFHMKLPVFVARQIVRTRTARLNEISGRYSVMKDETYIPEPGDLRKQSNKDKQATFDTDTLGAADAKDCVEEFKNLAGRAYRGYTCMMDGKKLAREQARINLTLGLYTEWYFQLDLHNLMNFLRLRLDWHAQKETRVYAEAMAKCVEAVAPMAWRSFCEHTKDGNAFSKSELTAIRQMLLGFVATNDLYTYLRTDLGFEDKPAQRLVAKLKVD